MAMARGKLEQRRSRALPSLLALLANEPPGESVHVCRRHVAQRTQSSRGVSSPFLRPSALLPVKIGGGQRYQCDQKYADCRIEHKGRLFHGLCCSGLLRRYSIDLSVWTRYRPFRPPPYLDF